MGDNAATIGIWELDTSGITLCVTIHADFSCAPWDMTRPFRLFYQTDFYSEGYDCTLVKAERWHHRSGWWFCWAPKDRRSTIKKSDLPGTWAKADVELEMRKAFSYFENPKQGTTLVHALAAHERYLQARSTLERMLEDPEHRLTVEVSHAGKALVEAQGAWTKARNLHRSSPIAWTKDLPDLLEDT